MKASKTWQLDHTLNSGTGTVVDAMFGLPQMAEITDGTSVSMMIVEDVGQNEKMLVAGTSDGANANSYIDGVTGEASRHWRWANPDIASGQSKTSQYGQAGNLHDPGPDRRLCVGPARLWPKQ